jgi:hypothetical protein
MTVTVKHKFVSAKVDTLDNSRVQPSNWNDTHSIQCAAGVVLGRTAGVGQADVTELPMTPLGQTLLNSASPAAVRAAIVADDSFTTISAAALKTPPVDADTFLILDSAAGNAFKRLTWANIKATLLAYFSPMFQPVNAVLTALAAIGAAAVGDSIIGNGVGTWARLAKGTAGQRKRMDDAGTTWLWGDNIQSSAVLDTSTGAVSYNFTGIPAWAKRITVCLNDVSYNGSTIGFRLGTAGGYVAAGYKGTKWDPGGTVSSPTMISSSTSSGSDVISGLITLVRMGASNVWAFATNIANTDTRYASLNFGSVDVGGVVDRIQMVSFNGVSVGDNGQISIIWE